MRTLAQVIVATLIGAIAGFWYTANTRPEVAHGILRAAAERAAPYSTAVADALHPPALRDVWANLHTAEFRALSPDGKEHARARYERAALRELREMAHNPNTFELVRVWWSKDVRLCVIFRAANGFNAITVGRAYVIAGLVVPESFADQSFKQTWNRDCDGTQSTRL